MRAGEQRVSRPVKLKGEVIEEARVAGDLSRIVLFAMAHTDPNPGQVNAQPSLYLVGSRWKRYLDPATVNPHPGSSLLCHRSSP